MGMFNWSLPNEKKWEKISQNIQDTFAQNYFENNSKQQIFFSFLRICWAANVKKIDKKTDHSKTDLTENFTQNNSGFQVNEMK